MTYPGEQPVDPNQGQAPASAPYPVQPGPPYGNQQPYPTYSTPPVAPYGYQPYQHPYPGPYAYPAQYLPLRASDRPAPILGAAVLGYVLAGLLLLAGSMLVLGAMVNLSFSSIVPNTGRLSAELAVDGVLNVIAAALLIAGGVTFSSARSYGRWILAAGLVITLMCSTYWAVRWGGAVSTCGPWS
ncbi:MAG: hypothetical protein ABI232_07830 [Jatrophihabitantaceae bacterium]